MLHRRNTFKKHRIDNVTENDLIANGWDSWNWSGNDSDYVVKTADIQRPDIICINAGLGSNRYWWIVMKYNKIEDVWNDLKAGMVLKIPPKVEMDKFYTSTTKREELK